MPLKRTNLGRRAELALAFCLFLAPSTVIAQTNVLTAQYDNNRTGANLSEQILTTTNVNAAQFGKVFSRPVDSYIYAQPLYVSNVNLPGIGLRNVVYVATMQNSIYAFDADDPNASAPIWQTVLGVPVPGDSGLFPADEAGGLAPTSGIVSTPVIDLSTNTIYAVALCLVNNTSLAYQLHALDIVTGQEKSMSPVTMQANVAGSGPDAQNGVITFNTGRELQRPALLLANGVIYVAFGSYGDLPPYHGWVLGFGASTLALTSAADLTPAGGGGIWQSSGGLSSDSSGFVYVCLGNGEWDGTLNFGESCVKLNSALGLSVSSWFTPDSYAYLDSIDSDLGSGRPVLAPSGNFLMVAGKQGIVYVLDTNALGSLTVNNSGIVQEFTGSTGALFSGLAYWNNATGPLLYVWGSGDDLKSYALNGNLFGTTPASTSTIVSPSFGAALSISSNGDTPGTGIVWGVVPASAPGFRAVAGTIYAFDALNLSNELWNSNQNSARDSFGLFAKFAAPTISNGKVYLPTFSDQLMVYGIISPTPVVSPTSVNLYASMPQLFTAAQASSWSLSGNVGSITSGGLYTAPPLISSSQTVTVTATSIADTTQVATAVVTLLPVSVNVTPSGVSLFPGASQQFSAIVTGTNPAVTWSIGPSDPGSISITGVYTAPTSISSSQIVTITATSVADGTKSASTTLTLNPTAQPTVTQQPQSVMVLVGESATFTAAGLGGGLSYQWQSKPAGAGSFGAITGAVSSSYSTPATMPSDNGTQFECLIANSQGSITTIAVTLTVLPVKNLVTNLTLGALRNNFTGWVGMSVTVGAQPLLVGQLGRFYVAGNSANHTVKIVNGATGADMVSATVVLASGSPGGFVYATLPSPVTLNANATYYILSQETSGGDRWYDDNTSAQTTADGSLAGAVYGTNLPYIALPGLSGHPYVPMDIGYAVAASLNVTPTSTTLSGGQTQQFNATVAGSSVAVAWSIAPSNVGSISSNGVYSAPGSIASSQIVTVTATSVQNTSNSASASVTLTPSTGTAIIQQPRSAIVAVGQTATFSVTATGAGLSYQWQSMPPGASTFTSISGATSSSYTTPATAAADNGTQFLCVVTSGSPPITSNAAVLSVPGTSFVQTGPTSVLRNNFNGWVGMNLTIGANAATVTAVGRMCVAGNSAIHTAKFVNGSSGAVVGGSAQVNMSGCVPGQFVYSMLASPLTLPPNTTYYLATQELSGGDQWHDLGPVSTTTDALVASSAYSSDGVNWIPDGSANTSYVPPNFLYTIGLSAPPGPDLTVAMSHSGNFAIGEMGQNYTITVTNSGGTATSGTVSLIDSVPNGLIATGIAGSAWTCTQPAGPCSRSDSLAPHISYPALTLTVNVSATAPGILTNSATVSGGGEVDTGNDTAIDPTIVTAQPNASIFLTSYSQTGSMLRNNFTGWAGLQLTVGSQPLEAGAIGRICVAGNSGTHIAKLVNVATGADVAGSAVSLNMAGCTAGQFVYAALSASITLAANTSFYLVTQELSGGDQWYDHGAVSSTGDAAVSAAVYSFDSLYWTQASGGNTAYVPPNLQYLAVPATMIAVEVQASISGAAFTVDGTQYTSPQEFNWLAGSSHNVSAPSPQSAGVGTEYVFSSWSDGGASSHAFSPIAATSLTATFSTQYLLTATVAAPGGGSISANPLSTSGYYASGSQVQLTAIPNPGCTFSGWTGTPNGAVTMSGPKTVSAAFLCSGPTATNFVTAYALNNPVLRNNFSGWVGMEITVGASPISVSGLGRIVVAGNSGTHQVKFVQASSGADVSGGSAVVSTSGQTAGQFSYQALTAPITLQAFTAYYLVSAEVNGGDQWYDHGSISTTSAASVNSSVYYTGSAWVQVSPANTSYVPVDFQYTAAPNAAFVTAFNLNNPPLRNNFTGWVGMKFTVGAAGMTVHSLGRVFVTGNGGTHTVKLVSASTGADVPGTAVTISMAGGTPGQFTYTNLTSPVALTPNASYYLVSQETSGGDQWYDYGTVATAATGMVTGAVYSFDSVNWTTVAGANLSYVPPNLK